MTVLEAAPNFIAQGLATKEEIEHTLAQARLAMVDENVLLKVARMTQVWAQRP